MNYQQPPVEPMEFRLAVECCKWVFAGGNPRKPWPHFSVESTPIASWRLQGAIAFRDLSGTALALWMPHFPPTCPRPCAMMRG